MSILTVDQKSICHTESMTSLRKVGVLTFIVALITLLAFVAIIGAIASVICFSGLNVVQQIILPVILPSCLVLVCIVIPLMLYIVGSHKKINLKLKELGQQELRVLRSFYETHVLIKPDKNKIAEFLEESMINIPSNKLYRQEFLHVIKDLLPKKKERSADDLNLIEGIERAVENLRLSAQQRGKRDEQEKKNK